MAVEQSAPGSAPASGLFVADYATLPKPTHDLSRAKEDILTFGYCAPPLAPSHAPASPGPSCM